MSREVNEAAKAHAVGKMETDISDVIAGPIESFLAGAEWMRQQFTPHGTDGCRDCETGRATMYVTLEGRCIECHHKRARTSDVSFPNGSSVTFNETAPDDPIRGLSKPVHNHPQSYSTQCVACTQNEDAGWRKYADCDCDACKPARAQDECAHEWGTDGMHSNVFCKKCFKSQQECKDSEGK